MYTAKQLRAVFGTPIQPSIPLSLPDAGLLAQQSAGKLSISGAQAKLSVGVKGGQLVAAPVGGRYILKPQTDRFPQLPENEYLCMQLAADCGIRTAPNILLPLADATWAYIVKRFDRTAGGRKLPCEDMGQLLGKTKYEGSYEQVGKAIGEECTSSGRELQAFFDRVLFCFVIGNGDAHLKNFSLLTRGGRTALSPAYDLVSSRIVIPQENEELALALNGRKNRIARRDFLAFASTLEVPHAFADGRISAYAGREWMMQRIADSYLSAGRKDALQGLIRKRLARLGVGI
jgi:serine/threonine-protein kinase HipA